MRIFLGIVIAVVALGAAGWLHGWKSETVARATSQKGAFKALATTYRQPASWQGPLAIVIALIGVGAGYALIAPALRPAA